MLELPPVRAGRSFTIHAEVVELVDTQHSKCCAFGRVGSSPTFGTKTHDLSYHQVGFPIAWIGRKPPKESAPMEDIAAKRSRIVLLPHKGRQFQATRIVVLASNSV